MTLVKKDCSLVKKENVKLEKKCDELKKKYENEKKKAEEYRNLNIQLQKALIDKAEEQAGNLFHFLFIFDIFSCNINEEQKTNYLIIYIIITTCYILKNTQSLVQFSLILLVT